MNSEKNRAQILVITPTLGNRETLDRTINSVKEIGGDMVYHVLTAPASKCPQLKEKYPHLEVLPEPDTCKGIFIALNYALMKYATQYKYMTFINDDDYWLPNYKRLFDKILTSDVDIVYGRVVFVDENNKILKESASSSKYKSFGKLLKSNIILFTQQASIIKSELFIRLNGFDEQYKLIADTDFWLKAIETGAKLAHEKSICAAYTLQDDQLSSDTVLQSAETERMLKDYHYSPTSCLFEKIMFRLKNIPVYLNRL